MCVNQCPSGKMSGGNVQEECPDIATQDYKSVRLAAVICAALVNTQSHRERLTGCTIILLAQPAQLRDVKQ